MLSESHPIIRRLLKLLALPYCYFKLVNWKECPVGTFNVANHLLYIFFILKYFPDNYTPCRLWEIPKEDWKYYYGSSYDAYQRDKLRMEVQQSHKRILFDDKVLCESFCNANNLRIPRTYGILPAKKQCYCIIQRIFQNYPQSSFIAKPVLGSAGKGIVIISKTNDTIYLKDRNQNSPIETFIPESEMIAQELIVQHRMISKIFSNSLNTIRILTLYTISGESIIISATMRFGVGISYVDNWSAGGVAVGVDHNTGRLKKHAYDKNGNRYDVHPNSNFKFYGFQIPLWDKIVGLSHKAQSRFSFYKLLGLDIAVTEDEPILIEINSEPDIVFQEQTSGPLLRDKRVLREFSEYDLLFNKHQKSIDLNSNFSIR